MIKVSVMYANTPGARFDHTYLIKARLGNACKHYSMDKGLAGEPAPYVENYTDLRPVFQIGEVVVG
jgi:hypothetical protein